MPWNIHRTRMTESLLIGLAVYTDMHGSGTRCSLRDWSETCSLQETLSDAMFHWPAGTLPAIPGEFPSTTDLLNQVYPRQLPCTVKEWIAVRNMRISPSLPNLWTGRKHYWLQDDGSALLYIVLSNNRPWAALLIHNRKPITSFLAPQRSYPLAPDASITYSSRNKHQAT